MCLDLTAGRKLNNEVEKSRQMLIDSINSAECKFSSIFKLENNKDKLIN